MYYAGTCDMGMYRAHSVAAVSTCPEGGTPVPPPAGAAPAGGGRWGRVTELGIPSLALRWKAAPPLGISLLTLTRLQGPSSCVSLAYEQFFGGRVTRYGDNSVGRN